MDNDNINLHRTVLNYLYMFDLDSFHIAAFRNLIEEELNKLDRRINSISLPLNPVTLDYYYKLTLQRSLFSALHSWCVCFISSSHLNR